MEVRRPEADGQRSEYLKETDRGQNISGRRLEPRTSEETEGDQKT